MRVTGCMQLSTGHGGAAQQTLPSGGGNSQSSCTLWWKVRGVGGLALDGPLGHADVIPGHNKKSHAPFLSLKVLSITGGEVHFAHGANIFRSVPLGRRNQPLVLVLCGGAAANPQVVRKPGGQVPLQVLEVLDVGGLQVHPLCGAGGGGLTLVGRRHLPGSELVLILCGGCKAAGADLQVVWRSCGHSGRAPQAPEVLLVNGFIIGQCVRVFRLGCVSLLGCILGKPSVVKSVLVTMELSDLGVRLGGGPRVKRGRARLGLTSLGGNGRGRGCGCIQSRGRSWTGTCATRPKAVYSSEAARFFINPATVLFSSKRQNMYIY